MEAASSNGVRVRDARYSRRALCNFLCAFLCVFGGLALVKGVGPTYGAVHTCIANVLVERIRFSSGVRLHFDGPRGDRDPWSTTLNVEPAGGRRRAVVPIDLRSLVFLPSAAFIGLSIAVSLRSLREHLLLLALGLLILEPLLLTLVALPLLSFLGGTGPIRVFDLSLPTHAILQVLYRALVAPPGMAYAIPLLLWWVLVTKLNRRAEASLAPSRVRPS